MIRAVKSSLGKRKSGWQTFHKLTAPDSVMLSSYCPVLKVCPVFLQRETVVSSAHRSISSCVALVGFWAVAPHTQLSFPSIWSNAECRSVAAACCHRLWPTYHNSVCPFKINASFHGRNVTSIVVVNLFLPLVPINLTCWSDHNIPAWFFTVLLNECHPQKRTSVWRSEGPTWGRTVSLLTVLLHTAEFGLGNTLTVH